MKFQPGASGNPGGRPRGAVSLRSKEAQAIFEHHNFDSLEETILLAKKCKNTLKKIRKDPDRRLEYEKMLLIATQHLIRYQYPQLKAVEHTGQIDLLHRLEQLESVDDAELEAVLAAAEELLTHAHR